MTHGWTWVWAAALLLGAVLFGCQTGAVVRQNVRGGPYPAFKGTPRVLVGDRTAGLKYIGSLTVTGSRESALKAAAKRGARAVKLHGTTCSMKRTKFEYYNDGGTPRQRAVGTETIQVPGHDVSLYR